MDNTNGQPLQENKLRKFLFNELTLLIFMVGLILGVYQWVTVPMNKICQDQALIKVQLENHISHIVDDLDENKVDHDRFDVRFDKIEQDLTAILTILQN